MSGRKERARERVVLVHGLGRTARMFIPMRRKLQQAGFEPVAYDYPSTTASAPRLVEQFCAYLDDLPDPERRTHLVGFSLGGILIRGALLAGHPAHPGRVVMIGPPNRGASILSRREARLTRYVFGPAVDDLREDSSFINRLGEPEAEIGVIAGTRRFFLFNPSSWIHMLDSDGEPHDGTVKVHQTKLDQMADFVTVPANHTYMCAHEDTIRQTIAFLQHGRFEGGQRADASASEAAPGASATNR